MNELEKWDEVYSDSIVILDFFDFLSGKGISLGEFSNAGVVPMQPVTESLKDLIYECYDIDGQKLEQERRDLLTTVQSKEQT